MTKVNYLHKHIIYLLQRIDPYKCLPNTDDCLKTKIELVQSENNIKIDRLQEKNLKQSTEQQLKFNAMVCHYEEMLQKSTNEKSPRTAEMKTKSANEVTNDKRIATLGIDFRFVIF